MRSLKNRLVLSYITLALMTLLITGSLFFFLIYRYEREATDQLSRAKRVGALTELYQFMRQSPDLGQLMQFTDSLEALQGVRVEIRDSQGDLLEGAYSQSAMISVTESSDLGELLRIELQDSRMRMNGRTSPMRFSLLFGLNGQSDQELREQTILELLDGGTIPLLIAGVPQEVTLSVSVPSLLTRQLTGPSLSAFLVATAAALLLAIFLGWRISISLSRPLVSLSQTVQSMAGGRLETRSGLGDRNDEIGALARYIDHLASELSGTIGNLQEEKERMTRFLVDASHELRTPVTAIGAYLELLSGKAAEDPERRREYIETCISQNERSQQIVIQLLELLRLEKGSDQKELSDVDLCEVLKKCRNILDPLARQRSVIVHIECPRTPLYIEGDEYRILTAIRNIVENAIKYTHEGSEVHCRLDKRDGEILLTVTDQGEGIAPEDEGRVFDRFYRSKRATAPGTGLGLSIVRQAVELYGGSASLTNREDGHGAIFTLSIPTTRVSE